MPDPLDYYSHAPLVTPDRPVCLVGLPGSRWGSVARSVAMLSGLPLVWLDRGVEHRAGTSVDGVVLTRGGEAARLTHERALLPAALRQPYPQVIALSEITLTDAAMRDLVRATAVVVYLKRPVEALLEEIERVRAEPGMTLSRLDPDLDLLARLAELEAPMRRAATLVVDAGRSAPGTAGRLVIDALGWDLPVP
jgi:shikimate kinase